MIGYDPKADILTLKVREAILHEEELLDNDVVLGYDEAGKVVAVEVWDASKRGLVNALLELAKDRKEIAELIYKKTSQSK